MLTLGRRLDRLLRNRGITTSQFAARIGVARPYASLLRHSKRMPSVPTLLSICVALDLSSDDLLGLTELGNKK